MDFRISRIAGWYMKYRAVHFIRYLCVLILVTSCTKKQHPTPPETLSAFGGSNYFTAKWSLAGYVTHFELDVSSDNFITFIPGYESLRVETLPPNAASNIRAVNVTNLMPETVYQFRVRSVIDKTRSSNSSTFSICTGPLRGTSNYVKNITDAYSLITGTWKKYSKSWTFPMYPVPEPNGMTVDGLSYCRDQRQQITFNIDGTVKAQTPQGVTFFSGTYIIDSAISILGPPNYALVVKIPNYFIQDPVLTLMPSGQSFLNLTTDGTFMDFWVYSITGGGLRNITSSDISYVR